MPRCTNVRVKPNWRLKQRPRLSSTVTATKNKMKCGWARAVPPHISPVSPGSLDTVWFGPNSAWFGDVEILYDPIPIVTTPTPPLPPELELFSAAWAAAEEEDAKAFKRCWMQRWVESIVQQCKLMLLFLLCFPIYPCHLF